MRHQIYPREKADDVSQDLTKFPAFETYRKNLMELCSIDLSSKSEDEIERSFYERAILFQQIFGVNAPEIFNTTVFYRVRINLGTQENPDLIRTYSYPSPDLCKMNGRANLKGKAVFYCSDDAAAAILESKPQVGDVGYISVWQGNTSRPVKYGVCLPRNLRQENINQVVAKTVHELVDRKSGEFGDKSEHARFFHNFVAERFINELPPYSLTSWMANEMLYSNLSNDFIMYPSIAASGYSTNMAFHPNSADALLQFKKVLRFKFLGFDGSKLRFNHGRIGTLEYGAMQWKSITEEELREIMRQVSKEDETNKSKS